MEEWKPIEGFTEYQVSSFGRVKHEGVILKPLMMRHGYVYIVLPDRKHRTIHRLVAKHFIPNPQNYPIVDHWNNIKDDNRVENLRWTTQSMNQINRLHPSTTGEKHISKKEDGFTIQIKRGGKFVVNTSRKTLAEAIIVRDLAFSNLQLTPEDSSS